ncbi:MAG: DUF4347 domain-containing protein [Alphaproteobacteria bacterium]|nr:DUF4347 domain-containing protein [Alphaproteobacteria bacterium]
MTERLATRHCALGGRGAAGCELMVIDPTVDHIASLLPGVRAGVHIAVLDGAGDGAGQIASLLQTHAPVSALHIVAHGRPGVIQIGRTLMGADLSAEQETALGLWREALTADAAVLVYGCRSGAGNLVDTLADRLGVAVAASSTPIGNAGRGGDWTLDVMTGPIATGVVFDEPTRAGYPGLFDPPVIPNLPDVFCFRITDIERVVGDPEDDAFVFSFEVLNWTDQPAFGLAVAATVGTRAVDAASPSITAIGIDSDGRGGPLGGNDIGPGTFDTPAIHSGRGRGDLAGLENDWVNLGVPPTPSVAAWDATGLMGNPAGTSLPNVDLIGIANDGGNPVSGVPGVAPVTDAIGDSAVDGGPIPFDGLITSGPNTNGGGAVQDGSGNVLDGFTITIDDFDGGEVLSLNWNLLDGSLQPLTNSYGFGTFSVTRTVLPLSTGPALFAGNTGLAQSPTDFFDSVFFVPNPALFAAEFGGGVSGALLNLNDEFFLQEYNIFDPFPNEVEVLPTVTFSTSADVVLEGNTVIVTAELDEAVSGDIDIDLAVSALDGEIVDIGPLADQADVSGTLAITIEGGETVASTTLTVVGDGLTEQDELLGLEATGASGALQGLSLGGVALTLLDVNLFGILTEDTPRLLISGEAELIDAPGPQVIEIAESFFDVFTEIDGGNSLTLEGTAGANTLILPGQAGDYAISRDVATVILSGPDGGVVTFTARNIAQSLIFADGAVEVIIQGDDVVAGTQVVTDMIAPLTTPLDPLPALPSAPSSPPEDPNFFAIVVEGAPAQFINPGVFGQFIDAVGQQAFHAGPGSSLKLVGSTGANVFSLQANAADVEISRDAATIILEGPNGETLSFVARTTAQTLVFLDGAVDIRIEGGEVLAGDQVVTETRSPVTTALDSAQTSQGLFTEADARFDQLSLGGETSNIGRVTLDYQGSDEVQYLNLVIDGQWMVENLGLASPFGNGRNIVTTTFDLGTTDLVEQVEAGVFVSELPVSEMPAGEIALTGLSQLPYRIGGETEGGVLIDLDDILAPPPIQAGIVQAADEIVVKSATLANIEKFENQEQDENECVPGAVSSSLKYLQACGKLPEDTPTDIDDVGEALGTDEEGTPQDWHETKESEYADDGLSVDRIEGTSDSDIDDVIDALESGKDVEIDLDGHAAVVVGVRVKQNGEVELDIYDDNQEGDGADKMRTVTIQNRDGTPTVDGMDFQRFVVEDGETEEGQAQDAFDADADATLALLTADVVTAEIATIGDYLFA